MIRLTYNGMSAEYPTIEAAIMPLRECLADGPGVVVTVEEVNAGTLEPGVRVRLKDAPEETGWATSHPRGRENPGGLVEIDWESGGWTREEPGDLEVRFSWSAGWQPVSDRERGAA